MNLARCGCLFAISAVESVSAEDIVVADSDGVVAVPRAHAKEVLALAQEMDFKEHSMYAYIEKLKSIEEAVKKFGRL